MRSNTSEKTSSGLSPDLVAIDVICNNLNGLEIAKNTYVEMKIEDDQCIEMEVNNLMREAILKVDQRNQNEPEFPSPSFFQVIFDNLDFFVTAKHMTSTSRNKSIHWTNLLAVLDRVEGDDLDNTKPIKSVYDLFSVEFIPSLDHHKQLLDDLIPKVARVIADKIDAF